MFLFLVLINDAGFKDVNMNVGEKLTRPVNGKTQIRNTHVKYVDDLTIAEAMKLKNVLHVDNNLSWKRPLNYHNRTEQILNQGDSQVQAQLVVVEKIKLLGVIITSDLKWRENQEPRKPINKSGSSRD